MSRSADEFLQGEKRNLLQSPNNEFKVIIVNALCDSEITNNSLQKQSQFHRLEKVKNRILNLLQHLHHFRKKKKKKKPTIIKKTKKNMSSSLEKKKTNNGNHRRSGGGKSRMQRMDLSSPSKQSAWLSKEEVEEGVKSNKIVR